LQRPADPFSISNTVYLGAAKLWKFRGMEIPCFAAASRSVQHFKHTVYLGAAKLWKFRRMEIPCFAAASPIRSTFQTRCLSAGVAAPDFG
jgi:hypothetical protein